MEPWPCANGRSKICESAMNTFGTPRPYDVFLNHRGMDVRSSIGSLIYYHLNAIHKLRVFLDNDDQLQAGDGLSSETREAISTASVHIPIFSKNYAESSWCLAELCAILQTEAKIIPVFYGVLPSDLRCAEKGVYAHAIDRHREKGSETLGEWKDALFRVSTLSGFVFKPAEDDYGSLLKDIVSSVLKEVKIQRSDAFTDLVGIDEAAEDFENTVSQPWKRNESAKIVGIFGLGGIGKTTLAKYVYGRKRFEFQRSCFLADVRETTQRYSLACAQQKLLQGLLHCDFKIRSTVQGKRILKNRLRGSKVLIVLDDVDREDQIHGLLAKETLECGSLVLITSRHKEVLARLGIFRLYEVTGLRATHARELFCLRAFDKPKPRSGFEDLVKDFLTVAGGLPLSLKVFGGLVYGNSDKSFWKRQLEKMSEIHPSDLKSRLEVCYNALDREQKEIFLDIACFFAGEDKSTAVKIWNGSGWSGLQSLQILEQKCLVEYDDKSILKMHDHLRNLGREIVDRETSERPLKSSRLWRPNDISDLLTKQRGTVVARGIWNTIPRDVSWSLSDFRVPWSRLLKNCIELCGLPNVFTGPFVSASGLKLLAIEGDCVSTRLRKCLANLLWLRWYNCPFKRIPTWLSMKNLRVLELVNGGFEALWHDCDQLPLELRELTVSGSLRKFPKSIELLLHLEKIVFNGGIAVNSLPEAFCGLQELKHLDLSRCTLASLPSNFGNLKRLEHLDLSRCSGLQKLPESFGQLRQLKFLSLSHCCSLRIPRGTLGEISTLEYADFTCCEKLEVLPAQIVCQTSLRDLNLSGTRLQELPSDFGKLSTLHSLTIESEVLLTLPSSLGNLSHLICLVLKNCKRLKCIPESVGELKRLQSLTIIESGVEYLPAGVSQLKNLQHLDIRNCPACEVPFTVHFQNPLLSSIGQRMSQLKRLALNGTKVSKIFISGDVCPNLETLDLSFSNVLTVVQALPTKLVRLDLRRCDLLKSLPGISGLAKLQYLNISGSGELENLPSLAPLGALEKIKVDGCSNLQSLKGLAHLSFLEELTADGCWKLKGMGGLEHLERLKKIQVAAGNGAVWNDIQCLQRLPSKISSMILTARAVDGDERGVESILSSFSFPLFLLNGSRVRVNDSNCFGFQMPVKEMNLCSAFILCLICKASTERECDVCVQTRWNLEPNWDVLYSVHPNKEGEFIIMSIFTQDSQCVEQLKLCEYEKLFVKCEVKNGWMVMGRDGQEWKILEVWNKLFTYIYSKQLLCYHQA